MSWDVAVIGAGIAGLTAARRLTDRGLRCVVYEKARGPGGRCSTRRQGDTSFDHGAISFTSRSPRFQVQVEGWMARGLVAEWAHRSARADGRGRLEDRGVQRALVGTPRMSVLTRDLARDLEVVTERRVTRAQKTRRGWELDLEDGVQTIPFRALVVATPAPQAAALLPAAAAFREAVASVRCEPVHATMASFDAPLDTAYDRIDFETGPLECAVRNASKPGRSDRETWVLHSSSAWSQEHLDASQCEIACVLAAELGRVVPLGQGATQLRTHRWLLARAQAPSRAGAFWDPKLALGVCGDWLRGDEIEDAFESGHELAERAEQTLARGAPSWAMQSTR